MIHYSRNNLTVRFITAFVLFTASVIFAFLALSVTGYAQHPTPKPVPSRASTRSTVTPAPGTIVSEFGATLSSSGYVRRAAGMLAAGGKIAEDTFRACLIDLYAAGLTIEQALEVCSVKLDKDGNNAFGQPLSSEYDVGGDRNQWFDPTQVSAACGVGNSSIADGRFPGPESWRNKGAEAAAKEDAKAEADAKAAQAAAKAEEEALQAKPDAKAEADLKAKQAALKAAKEVLKEKEDVETAARAAYKAAVQKMNENDTAKNEQAADTALGNWWVATAARKGAQEAVYNALDNLIMLPNPPSPKNEVVDQPSPCEEALEAAREILYECNRNGWKSGECKQLQAKMNNCPDPTKIYVDPDQGGYVCGKNPDHGTIEELKNAWVAQCEKVSHPAGPDTNPCQPPEIDDPGRYIKAHMPSVCGPNAHPDSPDACIVKVKLETHHFGEVNIQQLAIFALNKFGGPIFVLPPKPGPGPGPAPPNSTNPETSESPPHPPG
jgi:hypothetical protein